jgi:hypothetical protein
MSHSPSPGLTALDRLSEQLLAAAPELSVAVAGTEAEREAAYRLRYEQVVAHGWADRERLPDGLEYDAFDADALHVCAWHRDSLVGTLRLVLPAPGRALPGEVDFELAIEPVGEVVEAGRLVIAASYRGDPAHRAWGALFACGWLAMRTRGFSVLAGAAAPRTVEPLRALGLPFEILGPARPHWGEDRHPVRLDPAHAEPRWFASSSQHGGS